MLGTCSCKIIAGHHTFNGSATSFVQRTEWDPSGAPLTNVTVASAHTDNTGDEFVLTVKPSKLNTTLWAVFVPGFYFDCALQGVCLAGSCTHSTSPRGVLAGEFLSFCGSLSQDPSTNFARNLVTAQPAGLGKGFLTVVCPTGSTCSSAPAGVTLPPHAIAVPLRDGSASLSGLGPAPAAPAGTDPKPVWRTAESAQAIIDQRLREVTASMDAEYPRAQVGQMRDSVEAIRTVMGWNTVWDQRVKVITPVSRTFGVNPFIMWDWDSAYSDGPSIARMLLILFSIANFSNAVATLRSLLCLASGSRERRDAGIQQRPYCHTGPNNPRTGTKR